LIPPPNLNKEIVLLATVCWRRWRSQQSPRSHVLLRPGNCAWLTPGGKNRQPSTVVRHESHGQLLW